MVEVVMVNDLIVVTCFRDKDQGFGIGATTGGPVSNRTGRGRWTDFG